MPASSVRKTVQALSDFAMSLPGTHEDHPWGELVVKVNKKVFIFMGKEPAEADHVGFSVKLLDSGPSLLEESYAEPTGYGLGKSGWVTVSFSRRKPPALGRMLSWIEESYRAVAPKKLVGQLDEEIGGAEARSAKKSAARKKTAGRKKSQAKRPPAKKAVEKKVATKKTAKKTAKKKAPSRRKP